MIKLFRTFIGSLFITFCSFSNLELTSLAVAQTSVIGCWTTSFTSNLGTTNIVMRIKTNNTWSSEYRTILPPQSRQRETSFKASGEWYFQGNQLIIKESNVGQGTARLDGVYIQTSANTLQSRNGRSYRRC